MSTIGKIITLGIVLASTVIGIALQFVLVREPAIVQDDYTGNTGELVSDVLVGQTFVSYHAYLSAIAVQFATYSGRANTETVELFVREHGQSATLRHAVASPRQMGDNQLYRFTFEPIAQSADKAYFFFVTSPTSRAGNAVTVDIDTRDPYLEGSAYVARRGGGAADPALLAQSGKPTADLAFATYHSVPLRVAIVHKARALVNHVRATWQEQRSEYITWMFVAMSAVLLITGVVIAHRGSVALLQRRSFIILFLTVLAAIGLGLRLWYARHLPLTADEGNYLYDAEALKKGVLAGGDGYVKAPLVIAWIVLWQLIAGDTLAAGRVASAAASVLMVIPLYSIGKRLLGRSAGLSVATLWAVAGAAILEGVYTHTQPVALLLGSAGIAALLKGLSLISTPVWWRSPFFLSGVALGLGVSSRKTILALGLVPLILILLQKQSWTEKIKRLQQIGSGFLIVMVVFLTAAYFVYGQAGMLEALGVTSAEDGTSSVEESQREAVRAYSIRGMTPFFRSSMPLILLSVLGLGLLLEGIIRKLLRQWFDVNSSVTRELTDYITPKLGWFLPLLILWWAWSFFSEYEASRNMLLGIKWLWPVFFLMVLVAALWPPLPKRRKVDQPPATISSTLPEVSLWQTSVRGRLLVFAVAPLWIGGLIFLYSNWLKFHSNYLSEFIPPLVLLSGLGVSGVLRRSTSVVARIATATLFTVVIWAMVASNYITYAIPHTGTYKLSAIEEAAEWAKQHIPLSEPIFTGAAAIPYVSGHRVSLDIAHPRWYAYEWIRKDPERLNTFLPPVADMLQAFKEAEWFLREDQTNFSFLMEYPFEEALDSEFEQVKGIPNGSNTLTFYRRVIHHE